jgi:hypothetical protein
MLGKDRIYHLLNHQFHRPPPLSFLKTMGVFIMEPETAIEIKNAIEYECREILFPESIPTRSTFRA